MDLVRRNFVVRKNPRSFADLFAGCLHVRADRLQGQVRTIHYMHPLILYMYELETARLRLRPFTLEDLIAHHQLIGSDPQVTWHGKTLSLEESKTALINRLRHWEEHRFGMWAVEEKASGNLLGHAGLQYLEDTDEVELGYYLGQPAWGKGFATEAGGACVRFGFETLRLDHITAVVRPENRASQRVLSKLGFQYIQDEHH